MIDFVVPIPWRYPDTGTKDRVYKNYCAGISNFNHDKFETVDNTECNRSHYNSEDCEIEEGVDDYGRSIALREFHRIKAVETYSGGVTEYIFGSMRPIDVNAMLRMLRRNRDCDETLRLLYYRNITEATRVGRIGKQEVVLGYCDTVGLSRPISRMIEDLNQTNSHGRGGELISLSTYSINAMADMGLLSDNVWASLRNQPIPKGGSLNFENSRYERDITTVCLREQDSTPWYDTFDNYDYDCVVEPDDNGSGRGMQDIMEQAYGYESVATCNVDEYLALEYTLNHIPLPKTPMSLEGYSRSHTIRDLSIQLSPRVYQDSIEMFNHGIEVDDIRNCSVNFPMMWLYHINTILDELQSGAFTNGIIRFRSSRNKDYEIMLCDWYHNTKITDMPGSLGWMLQDFMTRVPSFKEIVIFKSILEQVVFEFHFADSPPHAYFVDYTVHNLSAWSLIG